MGVYQGVYFLGVGVFPDLGKIQEVRSLALTDTEIRRSKQTERAYKLSDSGGLHLLVTPAGGKLWRWKYRFDGTEKLMALGRYPEVTLADARERSAATWVRGGLSMVFENAGFRSN